jgi:hypothetical protein
MGRHVQARTAADQAFLAEQERQARERQEEEQERAQAGVYRDEYRKQIYLYGSVLCWTLFKLCMRGRGLLLFRYW